MFLISLFYADDCLWGPWQGGHCNCVNETKASNRILLRNATGGGLCKGESEKIEFCNCTGEEYMNIIILSSYKY